MCDTWLWNQLGSCKESAGGGAWVQETHTHTNVRQQIVNGLDFFFLYLFVCLFVFILMKVNSVSTVLALWMSTQRRRCFSKHLEACTWTRAVLQTSIFPLVLPPCLHSCQRHRLHFWGRGPGVSCKKKKKSQDSSKLETAPSFFTSSLWWRLWTSSEGSRIMGFTTSVSPIGLLWLQLTYPTVYHVLLTAMLGCTFDVLTPSWSRGSWPVRDADALCNIMKCCFLDLHTFGIAVSFSFCLLFFHKGQWAEVLYKLWKG